MPKKAASPCLASSAATLAFQSTGRARDRGAEPDDDEEDEDEDDDDGDDDDEAPMTREQILASIRSGKGMPPVAPVAALPTAVGSTDVDGLD